MMSQQRILFGLLCDNQGMYTPNGQRIARAYKFNNLTRNKNQEVRRDIKGGAAMKIIESMTQRPKAYPSLVLTLISSRVTTTTQVTLSTHQAYVRKLSKRSKKRKQLAMLKSMQSGKLKSLLSTHYLTPTRLSKLRLLVTYAKQTRWAT